MNTVSTPKISVTMTWDTVPVHPSTTSKALHLYNFTQTDHFKRLTNRLGRDLNQYLMDRKQTF